MPKPGKSGQEWVEIPDKALLHKWRRKLQRAEAAAAVAAQIARAAAIFAVDEVVVYEEVPLGGDGSISLGSATLARVLQYLETPPFLRASLFPGSVAYPELRCAAALCPSLQTPHHSRSQEWQSYREGVVMRSEPDTGSFVDIGYERNAHVEECLPVGRRVTLHLGSSPSTAFVPAFSETMLKARLARPSEPRTQQGTYWGFSVRVATSLSRVLKEPGFKAGYDLSVGTARQGAVRQVAELVLPTFKHALVVLGGTQELEAIVAGDAALAQAGKGAADLFSLYLNCCPGQATASIRSEDAAILCLAYLHASLLNVSFPSRQATKTFPTRPADWKPPAGQVEQRLVRPAWSQQHDQPVRGLMWCPAVAPRKPPQAPGSSQAATPAAASEPGPSTPPPAKRTKAEPAAEPTKGKGKAKGKAAKAKPAPQPGRWLDRDCNAALNMQCIGESRWRPLELCYWPEQGALPAKGKEYPGLGYKRLRDKPPKAKQQQQPAEAHGC
ncbi:hypothetical protein QJQ45_029417 [Haematococcus lacustris]|nr:hypothetical protein QJQ45_029417 [Haematococcus lacustris]